MFHLGICLLEPRAVKGLLWLAVAVGCVSLASAQPRAADSAKTPTPADETTRLLEAQVALAKKGYAIEAELLTQTKRSGNVLVWSGRPEQVYHWSVNWLKAERDLSPRKEDQIAALEAHLKRMTDLRKKMGDLARDLVPKQVALEAEWYRLEAERWLAQAKTRERSTFRLIQPEMRAISPTIGQPGFVEAYEQTSIYPKVTGFIQKWNADIGDRVKKGDVLATLFVPEILEEWETKKSQVKLAEGRVELAKQGLKVKQAEIKTAEARVVAAKAMLKTNSPSRDAAEAAVVVAEAELFEKKAAATQAEGAVKIAMAQHTVAISEARRVEVLVGYLTLAAPYDGVIIARNANTFDFVTPPQGETAGRSRAVPASGSSSPVYVIARTDIVRVFVSIPEEDANFVAVGTKATVKIPAYQDKPISASVTRTSWALDEKTRTLRAEIDLPNRDGQILPGMYVYGKVLVKNVRRVWALPVNALEESGNKIFYWEYKNGRAVRRQVQTGSSDGQWIEVTRRRSPGSGGANRWMPIDGSEKVIVGDLSILTDGKTVKVTDTPSSP